MKQSLHALWLLCCACLLSSLLSAQSPTPSLPLGPVATLRQQFQTSLSRSALPAGQQLIPLRLPHSRALEGRVQFYKADDPQNTRLIGAINGQPNSSFFIQIHGNTLTGHIILRQTRQAFKYSADAQGNAYITETDINKIVCVDYQQAPATGKAFIPRTDGRIDPALLKLESFPGANGCILLDFDGQYVSGTPWNNGQPINAQPAQLSDAEIREAWELVSEDYKPFSVNITTNEAVFNTYAKNRRMRVIFTPTNTAAPGAGGVAYLESFSWNDDTPCWVFNPGAKAGGEAGAHEAGHTLGLAHDGRTSPREEYYQGHGSWAPIMGVGYTKTIVQWSKGEYTAASNREDDLSIITSGTYGVGYRADDYGNTTASASPLTVNASGAVNTNGLIERTGDIDVFSFSTAGGNVTLNFNTASRHPDLDILATLYNSSGTAVSTANPAGLSATISTSLTAGNYFVSVTGTGAGAVANTGYSNYGSLGTYSITGTIVPGTSGGNQPPAVSITAPASGSAFNAPATINISADASDSDGTVSQVEFFNGNNSLGIDNVSPYSISWTNVAAGSYTITARATDNQGAITSSAPISITVNGSGGGNCNNVPTYAGYPKVYRTGDKAVYNNRLWECLVDGLFNVPPSTAYYWWWKDLGACTGSIPAAAAIVNNTADDAPLIAYPNPVAGSELQLKVAGQPGTIVLIEIFDVKGGQPLLRQTQTISAKGSQPIRVDISRIPAGSWLLKVSHTASGKTNTTKIIRL